MRAQHLRRFRRTRQQRGVNPAATLQPDSCCGQLSLRNLQRGHNHALLGLNRRTIQAICTRRPHEVHHLCEGINVRICDIPIRSGVRMPGIEALQGRRRIGDHLRGVHPARRLARTGCAQQRKWLSGHRSRHSRSTGQRFEESRITGPGAIPARSSRIGREDHVLAVIGTAARCARGLPRWPYWLPPPRRACVLPASRSPTFPINPNRFIPLSVLPAFLAALLVRRYLSAWMASITDQNRGRAQSDEANAPAHLEHHGRIAHQFRQAFASEPARPFFPRPRLSPGCRFFP